MKIEARRRMDAGRSVCVCVGLCVCVHGVCVSAGHMPGQATRVVIVGIVVGQTLCMLNARAERSEERKEQKQKGNRHNRKRKCILRVQL